MHGSRRGLGFICIGLGVLALIVIMRGGGDRRGGGPAQGGRQERVVQQPAIVAPQAPQVLQPATNASPDYLRGYADGLEAGQQQQRTQQIAPLAPRGTRQDGFGGRGGRGGHSWLGLLALPFLILGGLLFFRNRGGRWRWNQGWGHHSRRPHGDHDHDRRPPSNPEPEQPAYTKETHRF